MFPHLSQGFHLLDLLLICLLLRSLQLLHDEVREVSTLGQQFCITASLRYLKRENIVHFVRLDRLNEGSFPHRPILQHYDLVHLRKEANPMGDQDPLWKYIHLSLTNQF